MMEEDWEEEEKEEEGRKKNEKGRWKETRQGSLSYFSHSSLVLPSVLFSLLFHSLLFISILFIFSSLFSPLHLPRSLLHHTPVVRPPSSAPASHPA